MYINTNWRKKDISSRKKTGRSVKILKLVKYDKKIIFFQWTVAFKSQDIILLQITLISVQTNNSVKIFCTSGQQKLVQF